MNLWIFETSTLSEMLEDAERVASCETNEKEARYIAIEVKKDILIELNARAEMLQAQQQKRSK